jgi:SAM-dependent methyltransferase
VFQTEQQPRHALLDPVSAYDRIAPVFPAISRARSAYLEGVERLISANIPEGSRSLLDVGAGDGKRAFRIARAANISDIVLLEPSLEMQRYWPAGAKGWTLRAEDLRGELVEQFDVITCLWNVLGHVATTAARTSVLERLGRLLSAGGVIFLDVNHRYNARYYGWAITALRFLQDCLRPRETNGDVVVTWQVDGDSCSTTGHVFTDREVRRIAYKAGLSVAGRYFVDYSSGELRRSRNAGNLLYILRPANGYVHESCR